MEYALTSEEYRAITTPAPRRSKTKTTAEVTYQAISENELDLIVERKCGDKTRAAIFLVSEDQFYMVNSSGKPEEMTPGKLKAFFDGTKEPFKVETKWIKSLERGLSFSKTLIDFLKQYPSLIKEGLIDFETFCSLGYFDREVLNRLFPMSESQKKLAKYALSKCVKKDLTTPHSKLGKYNNGLWVGSLQWLALLAESYGVKNTKAMIEFFAENDLPLALADISEFEDLMKLVKTKKETGEYIQSFRKEGFNYLGQFMWIWHETLKLQVEIYGKVVEPFPENLLTQHAVLELKYYELKRDQRLL